MKKILVFAVLGVFFLTGCQSKNEKNIYNSFKEKVDKSDSYYLDGTMELTNNEDIYTYDLAVSYKKDDYYKIELTNKINNHKQVILRNNEGVYVITPSLNKSFKFKSDWPYNNSQVYLLSSVLEDITNDTKRTFEVKDKDYIFKTSVNYPNNEALTYQKVYMNKDGLPKKIEVFDKNNNIQIKMQFARIDLKTDFNDTYFDLSSIINTETPDTKNENINTAKDKTTDPKNNETKPGETQEPNGENNTKQTASIEDIIYPMYLPANTYLTNQEKVKTENGERLVLTFTGDNSFTLIEETIAQSDAPEIRAVSGDIELIGNALAVINDNSANWFDNGIEYYLVSDKIDKEEILQVAKSISVLPVGK